VDQHFLLVCQLNSVERFLSNEVRIIGVYSCEIYWSFLGDYVLVEDIEEGDKVKAEIVQILLRDNIKYIRSQNRW
jgi:hypothetical protein